MKENVNNLDKFIRIFFSILLIVLVINIHRDIMFQIVFGITAVYLIITAILGNCPLYSFLEINTKSTRRNRY